MKRTMTAVLALTLCLTGLAGAAQAASTATAEQKKTIIAMELMNKTLGDTQEKVAPRLAMMREYLKQKNLVEDFAKSQGDAKADASMLAYEDAVSAAVAHVTDNDVAADIEFDDISAEQADRDIKALQALVEPRFEEVQQARGTTQRVAAFLKSKGQLPNYMDWAVKQQDDENAQQAKTDASNREKDEAEAKAEQMRSQKIHQQLAQEQHADHQAALQRQFELQEQQMQDDTTVQAAKYSGGGYDPYWYGGWADPYYEVNVHRNHPLPPAESEGGR